MNLIVGLTNTYYAASFLFLSTTFAFDIQSIVVVILSQGNEHHLKLAENLKSDIFLQADALGLTKYPVVHLSHDDFPHVGSWTILPLIPRLSALHENNSSWIFFIEDRTSVQLRQLLRTFEKYNHDEEIWMGYALHDREATIIHHFAFFEDPKRFKYPNIATGFAISNALLKRLSHQFQYHGPANTDFSIDSSHELALFIWQNGSGPVLKHESSFCAKEGPECASFPTTFQSCGKPVEKDSIYFAVKTCKKFHRDRIPVVKKTWAKHASIIKYFSDLEDEQIPTVSLGIPNTDNGHCGKTEAIFKYVEEEITRLPTIKWLVIVDDDTILSVSRLRRLLSCYDASEPIALGERYGYNVYNSHGYNYITGGGGMVFSRVVLEQLISSELCRCPSISTPDDMFIGLCLRRLGVDVTHLPFFHQARPVDYAPEYLGTKDAISFHKHWMIDPIKVYKEWFMKDDRNMIEKEAVHDRTEL